MKITSLMSSCLLLAGLAQASITSQTEAIDPHALIETILMIDAQQAEQINDLILDGEYVEGETNDEGEFEQKVRIVKKIYIKYLPDTTLMHDQYLQFYKEGELQDDEETRKEAAERLSKKIKRKSKDVSWQLLTPFHEGERDFYDIVYVGVPGDLVEGRSCHHFQISCKEKDATRINGDYYFDSESFHLVRVDFTPAKLTSNLMFKMKQLDMSIKFGPTPEGHWLPRQFDINGRGKAMFLIGVKFSGTEYYTNGQINSGFDSAIFEDNDGQD
ncbi:MAG: hypothetical protein OEV49_06345 [candidate division Zixibacteria bacterium]|nr:hypothetical protein [candidate division Zixibacteria bacterium]MDH3938226.1 hypothetical protein [candidate division Zixibacteria bacterium]MDH4032910.1 hypothetical protein [candidate division Zixibacteria bacterium]